MSHSYFEEWLQLIARPSRILLVEDEPHFVELVKRVGENYNCEIVTVPSVEEAETELSTKSYNVALLDLKLPGKPGIKLLQFIRERSLVIPIIVLSGFITTELVDEASQLGVVAFFVKPSTDVHQRLSGLFQILGVKSKAPSHAALDVDSRLPRRRKGD